MTQQRKVMRPKDIDWYATLLNHRELNGCQRFIGCHIAKELGYSTSIVNYHLNKLVEKGKLTKEVTKYCTIYYLTPTTPNTPPMRSKEEIEDKIQEMIREHCFDDPVYFGDQPVRVFDENNTKITLELFANWLLKEKKKYELRV